jgi:SOS-response transcriptional repressor LexA
MLLWFAAMPFADDMAEKKVIPNSVFFSEVKAQISEGRKVVIPVKGNSMLPFIREGKDSVELGPCKDVEVGDILLVRLDNGHYVLHRVWELRGENVILMGDGNVKGREECKRGQVVGIVSRIFRGEGVVDCSSASYRRCVKIWRGLLPIRRYILAIYRRLIKLGL